MAMIVITVFCLSGCIDKSAETGSSSKGKATDYSRVRLAGVLEGFPLSGFRAPYPHRFQVQKEITYQVKTILRRE